MHRPVPALSFSLRLPAISSRRQVSVLTPSCLIVYYMNKNVLFIFTQKIEKIFITHFQDHWWFFGTKKGSSHSAFWLTTMHLYLLFFLFSISVFYTLQSPCVKPNELWLSQEKACRNPKPWPTHHPQHWVRAGQPKIRKNISSGYISEDSQQTGFSIREAITKCQITRSSKR